MRRAGVAAITGMLLAGAAAISPPPAWASCAAPVGVPQAIRNVDLAFVGTATRVSNEGRWATFTIDDVWKGTPDAGAVEIHAGPRDPAGPNRAGTSVDRTYERGARYLVMATDPEAGGYDSLYGSTSRFEDNACSGTRPYVAALSRFRPANAPGTPPVTATDAVATGKGPWSGPALVIVGIAIVLALSAAVLVAWPLARTRRRRSEV